ncbi:aspartyl asparaginyl beta-hydroxylase [Aureococcus anophagefferens]|uniref:Aspartyl asparaginyl beta-hydroxylase n=1 Tax=Aureococcus anophagefferens TaxID=44056 RepID=A0ABR1FY95_AURAN
MDGAALRFYDFVHDYCRCLRRLGRPGAADGVFEASRNASGASFPWAGAPAQMPCCGALAPAAVLPVEGERPWHGAGARAVVGAPTAVAVDGAGFCCRVEILRLDAAGHVLPHTAPTNARLKAHLGLATPPAGAASLTVAGETRTFDDGTVLCFDDSFWHEARNDDGAAPRYVLSVDFWKEGLAAR